MTIIIVQSSSPTKNKKAAAVSYLHGPSQTNSQTNKKAAGRLASLPAAEGFMD
jgi:hypothetical protein